MCPEPGAGICCMLMTAPLALVPSVALPRTWALTEMEIGARRKVKRIGVGRGGMVAGCEEWIESPCAFDRSRG